jgi:peptide/nickel transport system substrate-binding protein
MKKLLLVISVVVLVSGLLLSGCTKQKTTPIPTMTPTQATEPQNGGVLKFICAPGISNIGYPGKSQLPNEPQYMKPAVEYLLTFDPEGTGSYMGQLATGFQWGSDYKTLTLTLREGVKFQDGTDFNAVAAKYNLELHRNGARTDLKPVTSIDIIDDYTIRLNLNGYDAGLLVGLCSLSGYMVSPTSLEKLGDDALLHPVGTGPFKFVSYQVDTSLIYEKWDGYWQQGKPYLDGMEFDFIKDPVTQLSSFKAGEAQVIQNIGAKDVADMQASGKYNFVKYGTQLYGLAGDSAHPDSPFADIRVRRAISYAIDNKAIADAVGVGLYKAVNQYADPDNPVYNPAVVGYPYNPDKAKQLLTEANYPNGFNTKITYDSTDPIQTSVFSIVQGYLSAVGINAELDAADPGRFFQLSSQGWDNQLVYHWIPVGKAGWNPSGQLRAFLTNQAFLYSPKSLWTPDDYNALFQAGAAEPDFNKCKEIFQKLRKMITDDYCLAIPIMMPYCFLAKTQNVHDMDMFEYAMGEWLPENAWLSK